MSEAASSPGQLDEQKIARYVSYGLPIATLGGALVVGFVVGPATSILVVAADDPQLKPAVGARVSIDAEADAPFVITSAGPKRGDTVVVSLRLGKRSCHGWGGRRQHRSSYVPRR